jgi:hypothetical protein
MLIPIPPFGNGKKIPRAPAAYGEIKHISNKAIAGIKSRFNLGLFF